MWHHILVCESLHCNNRFSFLSTEGYLALTLDLMHNYYVLWPINR